MALCTTRLRKEYVELQRNQLENIKAAPKETNIREWHYVIFGQKDSPYSGGFYHGTVLFPSDYPYKPPTIRMITPSGRFKPGARLCLSMSDFHPETWNPMWSVSTILLGLYSFMNDTAPTNGSVESSEEEKKLYAKASMEFNLKDKAYCEMFPDLVQAHNEQLKALEESEAGAVSAKGEDVATDKGRVDEQLPATVATSGADFNQKDPASVGTIVRELEPSTAGDSSAVPREEAAVKADSDALNLTLPSATTASVALDCPCDATLGATAIAATIPEPTTPPVSSMYTRMMAMKLASPSAQSPASDAINGADSSSKSVQSVDTVLSEPYKAPSEDVKGAVYPPQPPV